MEIKNKTCSIPKRIKRGDVYAKYRNASFKIISRIFNSPSFFLRNKTASARNKTQVPEALYKHEIYIW